MLLLLESSAHPEHLALAAAARAHGVRVEQVDGKGHLPHSLERGDFTWAVFFGAAPSPERYERLHDAARALNITLLNDATQHRVALELDRTTEALAELTARTEVLTEVAQLAATLGRLPPPVFVRGALGSHKRDGWSACVANDGPQAEALVRGFLSEPGGRALVRELLPLRRTGASAGGFPVAREYRLFVLDADVVGCGYCWAEADPFGALTPRELDELRTLAHEAARRTRVPWLAVDVAQLESGAWKVIETGDPGFTPLGSLEPRALVSAVAHGLELRAGC